MRHIYAELFACFSGALSFAELGTLIPKSGGDYIYLYEALGPIPAFLYSFMTINFLKTSSLAIIALTCAEYITVPLFDDDCPVPVMNTKLLAVAIVCKYLHNDSFIKYLYVSHQQIHT